MLGIVQAFMHDPDLIIMDEPTAGLDPLKQDRLHEFIRSERDAGKTVFFSSHFLSEVQRVCDRVGIIREGALIDLEDVEGLLKRGGKQVWVHLAEPVDEERFVTEEMIDVDVTGNAIQFTYTGDVLTLLKHLVWFGVEDVDIGDPQLDDVFKHYYGDEPRVDAGARANARAEVRGPRR